MSQPIKTDKQFVDAIYITANGTTFDCEAEWPHQNSVILQWDRAENEDDEDVVTEFVYFGTYKNRLIYHDIAIEAEVTELT